MGNVMTRMPSRSVKRTPYSVLWTQDKRSVRECMISEIRGIACGRIAPFDGRAAERNTSSPIAGGESPGP